MITFSGDVDVDGKITNKKRHCHLENGHLGFDKIPPATLFQVKFEIVNESLTEKELEMLL